MDEAEKLRLLVGVSRVVEALHALCDARKYGAVLSDEERELLSKVKLRLSELTQEIRNL